MIIAKYFALKVVSFFDSMVSLGSLEPLDFDVVAAVAVAGSADAVAFDRLVCFLSNFGSGSGEAGAAAAFFAGAFDCMFVFFFFYTRSCLLTFCQFGFVIFRLYCSKLLGLT
jgi:hypothetical protein